MELVQTKARLAEIVERARRRGDRVALVPTMGFLHQGHMSLVREGRRIGDLLVVSIFVNPTQFGPSEDLDAYPRDLERDMAMCEAEGVDVVFAPPVDEIYPAGFDTTVKVGGVTEPLCGARRPGHFDGVATVVLKLFNMVRPHVAVFGMKDYQQLLVIRKLVRDLDLDVEVVGMPTVREPDGLAMSSRNSYLTQEERQRALALPRGLDAAAEAFRAGERDPRALERVARAVMEPGISIDYVEVRDAGDLTEVERVEGPVVIAAAAFVGKARLIDNRVLTP